MSAAEQASASGNDLDAILARVAHWLPTQGPIKDFIHHNTLHAFQWMKFHDAVRAAARLYGARSSMPRAFFLEGHASGRISNSALNRMLQNAVSEESQRPAARAALFSDELATKPPPVERQGLRAGWTDRLGGVALHRRSQLHLFRLFGGYLDQGLSIWRMPGAEQAGFYDCVARLARESPVPLLPFDTPRARELLRLPAREALEAALARTVGRSDWYESYLLETLLSLSGWAGLIGECERKPGLLLTARQITLVDCAAVVLVAELACLERELGAGFAPLHPSPVELTPLTAPTEPAVPDQSETALALWQDAFEWSYYEPLLGALRANASRKRRKKPVSNVWAAFCLDDRFCSVRRHLEEVAPSVSTFGTAGFFGLDFFYRGSGDAIAGKHCPAPMTPHHLIVEAFEQPQQQPTAPVPWWRRATHFDAQTHTFFRGWVSSYALGLGAAVRLAGSVFRPSLAPVLVPPLSTVNSNARFKLVREGDARSEDGLWLGYSPDELADRVAAVLRSIGADRDWPELVVLFGHGASSVNNPYFAAYNCGACSGRVGAPNARAFAKAANHPAVREKLRERGLSIPDSTRFVGALYDTTRDEATYYDLERVPEQFRDSLTAFRKIMEEVSARNAAERCRRFESVPLGLSPEEALEAVRERSISVFEPRPEYNHATNASCIVGRRELTAGLFLDRRAFLNSYDPSTDPQGQILAGILSAAVPVCAGINLEYFFSRLDPQVYGAGTKLPHNVNGLIGVCNGVEGDLLTGLPIQMTEIHDPVRLIVVVEQSPEIALDAARRNASVFELIEHEWVQYGCIDPTTHDVWMYRGGRMVQVENLAPPQWAWPGSLEAARQGRDSLPVGYVGPFSTAGFEEIHP